MPRRDSRPRFLPKLRQGLKRGGVGALGRAKPATPVEIAVLPSAKQFVE